MDATIRLLKGRLHAPLIMFGSLAASVLLATAHHLFYTHLQGRMLASVAFSQQVNLATGTVLAYLVRALLRIAIGTAYAQILWYLLLKAKNELSIATVDSLSSLLFSIVELCRVSRTWRHPTSLLVGLVAWIIPLSTIMPPATLSVESAVRTNYHSRNVTTIDWARGKGASFSTSLYDGVTVLKNFGGATSRVAIAISIPATNLAVLIGGQGKLPVMPIHGVNSSYRISLPGPTLECHKIPAHTVLGSWSRNCRYRTFSSAFDGSTGYLSWIPAKVSAAEHADINLSRSLSNVSLDCTDLAYIANTRYAVFPDQRTKLFVAVQTGERSAAIDDFWTVVQCQLLNATYTVEFTSGSNAEQIISVINKTFELPIPGSEKFAMSDVIWGKNRPETGSYLATLGMMQSLVGGVISEYMPEELVNEQILNTKLSQTVEFAEFHKQSPDNFPGDSWAWSGAAFGESVVNATTSLASTLEELHQNLTLALFSFPQITTNSYSTNVSTWRSVNIYNYTQAHLLSSYGLGILVALIAVLHGLYISVLVTGSSYRIRFSTFLRTTRWKEVSSMLVEYDNGADPLAKPVGRATISFGHSSYHINDVHRGEDTSSEVSKSASVSHVDERVS